jgi:cell division protein FtsB
VKDRILRRGDSGSPFVRVIVVLFFVFLFAVGASMYISQNVSYARVSAQSEVLADSQEAVLRENEEAKNVQMKVGTDDYTEEMARNQLGMVKPGETIFDRDG